MMVSVQNVKMYCELSSSLEKMQLWWEFFSSPPCPDRLWGPPSLLSNGYQVFFPWGLVKRLGREADHSPPWLRMHRAMPSVS